MGIYLLFTFLMGIENLGCVILSCSNKAEGLINRGRIVVTKISIPLDAEDILLPSLGLWELKIVGNKQLRTLFQ